jgi:hypothetical protein
LEENNFINKSDLEIHVKEIINILREFSHHGQADYMDRLLESLEDNGKIKFADISKTIDIWGGSGAVWQVWIDNRKKEIDFQNAIIKFARLLNENGISNHGISSIKTLFEKGVKK